MAISISKAAELAARWTAQAANIKDWRLNARDRRFKALAAKLTEGGPVHGYVIANVPDLKKKYPDFVPEIWTNAETVYIWGIRAGVPDRRGRVALSFTPVYGGDEA